MIRVCTTKWTFTVLVLLQMTGDLGEGEQALVDLKLQDFRFLFTKADQWTKNIEVFLHSLVMEDLLQVRNTQEYSLKVEL